jgi:16S rRNA (cytosine967-C5)-methyltransferase
MIAPARVAAYEVLHAVSSGRADLSSAVAEARASLVDERDRALLSEISTGVQRWRGALDHLIAQFARRPLDRLDPEIVEILRIGLYQLTHLTRVPAPAIVDDAVDLSRRVGKTSATGLVNAVLRAAVRNRRHLPLPPKPADEAEREAVIEYLSVTLSHPRWLANRWLDRLGFDVTETWMRFNNEPAPLTLRANRLRVSRDELAQQLALQGVRTHAGRFAPDALLVDEGRPTGDGFVIQDEASQIVTLLAGEEPGPRVLDTCASPGGKATALAAAMRSGDRRTLLVACDVRAKRIELLRRTIAATGAREIRVVQADLLRPLPFSTPFDCVIVDAPCSGLGTLRRDPDVRWRRIESDLPPLADAEGRMLRHAAEVVAPGGRLIYATCSSEPEENDEVVVRFLRECTWFAALDARQTHPALAADLVDRRGFLRTTPHAHGLEAFFGAVFQRTGPPVL